VGCTLATIESLRLSESSLLSALWLFMFQVGLFEVLTSPLSPYLLVESFEKVVMPAISARRSCGPDAVCLQCLS